MLYMPQMSPIMWPMVVLTLITLLSTIKSSMEKMSTEKKSIQLKISTNEKKWKW